MSMFSFMSMVLKAINVVNKDCCLLCHRGILFENIMFGKFNLLGN